MLIRKILIAVIAISVALLPATAEAIVSQSPAEITMVGQADMPCCIRVASSRNRPGSGAANERDGALADPVEPLGSAVAVS